MSLLSRTTQLRMRRVLRRRQKQVEAVAEAAEQHFDHNLIGRLDRLLRVKRFALGWLGLITLLILSTILQTLTLSAYYQSVKPIPGGTYNEGIVGTYSNANPIFATGPVDSTVSKLLFAGLLKYDDKNALVGDLAKSYTVDATGKHYVVTLRNGLTWQDGKPLTAADVAFTYHLIQNPDVESPLRESWQNIAVSAPNKLTVNFDLPNGFAAFVYGLTTGIVPEHLLSAVPPTQVRSSNFNTLKPVGAGPFTWQALQTTPTTDPNKALSLIALKPFAHYAHGQPKLDGFVLHAYGSQEQLVQAFEKRDVNAMAGLTGVPSSLAAKSDVAVTSFHSTAAVMTFFRTSAGVLADAAVRQALVQGADTASILKQLGYSTTAVKEPLLVNQLGYDPHFAQAKYDVVAAKAALDKDGWLQQGDNTRTKNGQPLTFRLYAQDTSENRKTVKTLVSDWQQIGVNATPLLQPLTDFKTTLEFHTYDALLYGISIGADPDVYAFWDSSQADIRSNNRLNFSEYKSTTADAALEAGRTRLDPALRTIKYKPFLQAWQADVPALGLYQPRVLYITRGTVYGLNDHTLNVDSDRYSSVANWEIRTAKVTN